MFFNWMKPKGSVTPPPVLNPPVSATPAYPFVHFDMDEYMAERHIPESARDDVFADFEDDFDDYIPHSREHRDWDEYEKESERRFDRREFLYGKYLQETRAVKTPIEVYAAWVELFTSQGGKITHRHNSFSQ